MHSDETVGTNPQRKSTGTLIELIDLLTRKVDPGLTVPETFTNRGYWTVEQVQDAYLAAKGSGG